MIEQGNKSHLSALESYKEAKNFAQWSAKDRAEKTAELPPLTSDQREQIKAYLQLMQEYHAFNPDSDLDPKTGKPR
jgi:hypothetical protein